MLKQKVIQSFAKAFWNICHTVYIIKENKEILSYGSTAISVGSVRKNFL